LFVTTAKHPRIRGFLDSYTSFLDIILARRQVL
jgi:hypothetical protein